MVLRIAKARVGGYFVPILVRTVEDYHVLDVIASDRINGVRKLGLDALSVSLKGLCICFVLILGHFLLLLLTFNNDSHQLFHCFNMVDNTYRQNLLLAAGLCSLTAVLLSLHYFNFIVLRYNWFFCTLDLQKLCDSL